MSSEAMLKYAIEDYLSLQGTDKEDIKENHVKSKTIQKKDLFKNLFGKK